MLTAPLAALMVIIWNGAIYIDSSALTAGTVQAAEKELRGATMGLHSMCGYAGGFLGPLGVGLALDLAGGDSVLGWGLGFGHLAPITLIDRSFGSPPPWRTGSEGGCARRGRLAKGSMPAAVELSIERPVTLAAADRASRNASLTLALAQPGDTLLYVLLPLHHDVFGVSLAEAGLLLAANRLVRIAGYGWVARFYADHGPKASCLFAAAGAALATFGYAFSSGVWALLVARLLWGLSFAATNIATQALATAEPSGAARRSGRMRAIIAAGPVSGLMGGAVIAQPGGPRLSFLILGVTALLAFLFAVKLPESGEGRPARLSRPRFGLPARLDIWSFIQGMTLDGLFVLGMSVLAAAAVPGYAALAAGATPGLRYIAEILLAPVGGALAHRFDARRVLTLLSIGSAAGLAVIGFGWLWCGALTVVVLRGLIQPIPPPIVASDYPGPERVPALASLATWRDLGAGGGPLLAGVLLPIMPHNALYGAAALLLALSAVAIGKSRKGSS
jgi:MFS family permease